MQAIIKGVGEFSGVPSLYTRNKVADYLAYQGCKLQSYNQLSTITTLFPILIEIIEVDKKGVIVGRRITNSMGLFGKSRDT